MHINKFKQLPIMGILRGVEEGVIEPLTETVISAGLQTIEITMNTHGAAGLIKRMTTVAQGRLTIGAGTVLSVDDLHRALDAGATFIVMPTLVHDVMAQCVKKKIPVFPGAFTPQEIFTAWQAGATMVKVFPAGFFGPAYCKEIKGPFHDIQLLACGGVNAESIGSFFLCGASAVAFGASIFRSDWLVAGNFSQIDKHIEALIAGFEKTKDHQKNA